MKLIFKLLVISVVCITSFVSCSTTSCIPDDDQLYIGLKSIDYTDSKSDSHYATTQEEIDAALATAPNGALLGSSFYRSPFPIGLWVWNAFYGTKTVMGKWVLSTFGREPVLMSRVNPQLRAQVAQNILLQKGFFNGNVGYNLVPQSNPKKMKIIYNVKYGPLYTVDTISYEGFLGRADSIINASRKEALITSGSPFDISTLNSERQRISRLLQNDGYYYFQSGYTSYLADTIGHGHKVSLKLCQADSLPTNAYKRWSIGNVGVTLRRSFTEQCLDSIRHRHLTIRYSGQRSPIRPRVVLSDLKLRPGRYYSVDDYEESLSKISSKGIFSMVNMKFTPRDTTDTCRILDLELECLFDKPYDVYFKTNLKGKTSGRVDPEIVLGLTKNNAFRGGEKLDINLYGSYEWQTGHKEDATSSELNSYEYGIDASIEFPRLLIPFIKKRRRWYAAPSTVVKASYDVINRSGFFNRHVVSGELSYRFQPKSSRLHQFSPLILQYEYMQSTTGKFRDVLEQNPYLKVTMADRFVPKMRYTYTYTSPASEANPISWQTTVSEASNLLSLGYAIAGQSLNKQGKNLFGNPFAQFLKLESDFSKTWITGPHDVLVFHAGAGVVWSYGNMLSAPYSEQFYVGGANSIRAFNVRAIGPGKFQTSGSGSSYMDQTGDIKLQLNLEYRPLLFGSLYGAIFLDAGNVWAMRDDGYRTGSQLQLKNLLKETALGTGIGIRYDLDFFVIRLDWGVALHLPYKSGFINIGKFADSHCLHLAIGYPF